MSDPDARLPPQEPLDEVELRRRVRRFAWMLLVLVLALSAFTFIFVKFIYPRLLDADVPPSVRSLNPKVLAFEVAFWVTVVLAVGFAANHFLRKRR